MAAWGAVIQGASELTKEFMANNRQEDQQDFNAEQALMQREWETAMYQNRYQYTVNDLMKAGLNPMLAYMHGAPGPGSGASASSGIASSSGSNVGGAYSSASQVAVNEAQEKLIDANADKAKAEADEIRARTPTHAVSIDQMRQNITESQERIKNIMETVKLTSHSAANVEQQTKNLQALIPQIEATVNNLRAHTKLAGAQTTLAGAQTTLAGAETSRAATQAGQNLAATGEINQRVQANLPALENALKELQRQARILEMPGRHQEAAVSEGYTGALAATLRALNPFSDFIKSR